MEEQSNNNLILSNQGKRRQDAEMFTAGLSVIGVLKLGQQTRC